MPADLFDRRTVAPLTVAPRPGTDAAVAARPRLERLRDALVYAAKRHWPARWNEPAVFFFDHRRQAELEAARPAPAEPFADLRAQIAAEMPALLATVEVRRVARAVDGLAPAARAMAPHCPAARELVDLLTVPDDEVFLALAPTARAGLRLHLRGAADAVQLYRLLSGSFATPPFQLFLPAALRSDGTLPTGFAGSEHWLWPTQPLAAVPRIGGERVVLVGPAVVRSVPGAELSFPDLAVEAEALEVLNAFQTADALARLCGRPVPVQPPADVPVVARAA